jgi:site-specific DNA-adenine methylase
MSSIAENTDWQRPARPPLRYHGGGWNRAAWTVAHFPIHDVYCEPCFGGQEVLLHKPPCKREIANDLDGRVVTFFTVLRERLDTLVKAVALAPQHETEYRRCLDVAGYRSELYAAAYEALGWNQVDRRKLTNSGGSAVECLWLSPLCYTRLHAPREAG